MGLVEIDQRSECDNLDYDIGWSGFLSFIMEGGFVALRSLGLFFLTHSRRFLGSLIAMVARLRFRI